MVSSMTVRYCICALAASQLQTIVYWDDASVRLQVPDFRFTWTLVELITLKYGSA